MRYIDLSVQSLLFLAGIVLLIVYRHEPMSAIFLIQLLLAPWQMTSSLISLITKAGQWRQKRIHLALSCLCLMIFFVSENSKTILFENSNLAYVLFLTIPPMTLAVFYYILTWKWVAERRNKGSFLPNLGF
jgi:hypothetical protein